MINQPIVKPKSTEPLAHFVINYQADEAFIRNRDINPEVNASSISKEEVSEKTIQRKWDSKKFTRRFQGRFKGLRKGVKETTSPISADNPPITIRATVKSNIMAGNSYLTNLTNRVPVQLQSFFGEFSIGKGKYKLLLRRKRTPQKIKLI